MITGAARLTSMSKAEIPLEAEPLYKMDRCPANLTEEWLKMFEDANPNFDARGLQANLQDACKKLIEYLKTPDAVIPRMPAFTAESMPDFGSQASLTSLDTEEAGSVEIPTSSATSMAFSALLMIPFVLL